MNDVRRLIFPGAIAGSLVLASFAYSVMARVPKLPSPTSGLEVTTAIDDSQNSIPTDDGSNQSGDGNHAQADSKCVLSSGFPEKVRRWCTQIQRHASRNDLDPNLIAAIIWQESGGNPGAYSKSGAVGLMQVMPRDGIAASFQCVNGPCFTNRPTINELEKPNFNIKYGSGMIAGLLEKHGDIREALKYYGPMNVGYYYADKVIKIYQSYGS